MSASTSPLPYTGNKSCIVNTILTVMPKHSVYIEPCMGSAEVFFRKPKAEREILNDYNSDLVNLFPLHELLQLANYSISQLVKPILYLYSIQLFQHGFRGEPQEDPGSGSMNTIHREAGHIVR